MSHRPPYRPPYHPPRHRRSSGTGRRVLWVLAIGAAAAVAVKVTTDRGDSYTPPPRPQPMAEMRPSKLQPYATDNAVVGGATAAQRELASRPTERADRTEFVSRTESRREAGPTPVVIRKADPSAPPIRLTRVRNAAPQSTEELALDDALLVARQQLVEKFQAMDPPIDHVPTLEQVRHQYLKPGSVRVVDPNTIEPEVRKTWEAAKPGHETWVEVDVEVSHEQLRELRADDRLGTAGWLGAAALLVMAALYGFLRVDTWTRGYLTGGLAIAAAAAAGGGVALLFLMR